MFGDKPAKYGERWNEKELILAFDLYCRIPFKKTKANNPDVISQANLLKRSPASVARKLGNFGSFDPELQKKNVKGLLHASKLDRKIWEEFHNDWNRLVTIATQLKNTFEQDTRPEREENSSKNLVFPEGPSEKYVTQKTRIHQSFFRDAILSSYDNTCCITGLQIGECLVASHIIPWSVSEEHRTDPRNGLCLSATFDRLFDRGLITVDNKLKVAISPRLLQSGNSTISEMICSHHGTSIILPQRFLPSPKYLEWHHENIFQD